MEEKKKPVGLIIGTIIVCVLVVVAIGMAIYIHKNKDKNKNNQTNQVVQNTQVQTNSAVVVTKNEAEDLIEEYYDIAESLYYLSNSEFKVDKTKYPSPSEILNYNEVINKYISKRFAGEFNPALLIKENGRYYIQISGLAEGYDNLRFENINVQDGKISCLVLFDLYVGDELLKENVESDFTIVYEDDDWKIDEYVSDYELHYEVTPDEAANSYSKNEKVEFGSYYGKTISDYIQSIWMSHEIYSQCMPEFQSVQNAPREYLAACSAMKTWAKFVEDGLNAKATLEDFNNSLVDLFGEKANGLIATSDLDQVFFLAKNVDGTYHFMGFDGSETSDILYSLKDIERKDNKFYVTQYEYKIELESPTIDLGPGEGVKEYIYDRNNKLITSFAVRAIPNGNITSYITYDESDTPIGTSSDVKNYILSNYADKLSIRHIELELTEDEKLIMTSNYLEK